MINCHNCTGSTLQKLNNTDGLSGVSLVVCHKESNNDEDHLLSNKTSPTSAGGNSATALLGKSIEKHGQTLVDIAKKEKGRLEKGTSGRVCSGFPFVSSYGLTHRGIRTLMLSVYI
jgi:hypothetical protein